MNNVLTLRGNRFEHRSRPSGGGAIQLPGRSCVRLDHLNDLHNFLIEVRKFWENNDVIDGVLVSVYYNRIVSKSNRINGYLNSIKNENPIDTVVGARFNSDKNKHIIFHTDLGSQYTSNDLKELCKEFNIIQSFSKKGCPYDNACIESFHNNVNY